MLLRFAANDVNHCVWRDSRVILSNQRSVFTQLAKKKKSEKTWSNSSLPACRRLLFNKGNRRRLHAGKLISVATQVWTWVVTRAMSQQRADELFATLIASPLCLCRLSKPSCDRVTNLEKYYPMLRKTAFRASFVVCVAAVSVRIRSEEQGTLSQRPLFGSRSIFRAANTENPVPRRSAVSFCSETTRKHLPHRLANHWIKFYHFCNTIAWQVHTRNSIVGDSRYKLFFEVFKLQSRSQITSLCPVKCC